MKRAATDLALLGGPRAFADDRHVGRPNIGSREALHRKLDEILDRRWLTNDGPVVQELEARIAALCGVKHAIAVCNATVGLELIAHALELRGDVILPAWTFVATAHAMSWVGLRPVFCDVDAATHNISVAAAEAAITERTSAIVATHLWGEPCDTEGLAQLCSRRGLRLVFDAAHAFGCSAGPVPIGGFGDAEVFSFHGTKFVNSFEGGAVTTNDDRLARKLRLMRNFGFAGFDLVIHLGTNAKMHEMSAAMALVNIDAMEAFVAANRENLAAYASGLEGLPGVALRQPGGGGSRNFQYVVLDLDASVTGVSRDALLAVLRAEGVIARRYFYPGCHNMEPYVSRPQPSLPVTDNIAARNVVLPTGTAMSVDDVACVTDIIRCVFADPRPVMAQLAAAPSLPPLALPPET